MAEREKRIRMFEHEIEQLKGYRDDEFRYGENVPLGKVVMYLLEEVDRDDGHVDDASQGPVHAGD